MLKENIYFITHFLNMETRNLLVTVTLQISPYLLQGLFLSTVAYSCHIYHILMRGKVV